MVKPRVGQLYLHSQIPNIKTLTKAPSGWSKQNLGLVQWYQLNDKVNQINLVHFRRKSNGKTKLDKKHLFKVFLIPIRETFMVWVFLLCSKVDAVAGWLDKYLT